MELRGESAEKQIATDQRLHSVAKALEETWCNLLIGIKHYFFVKVICFESYSSGTFSVPVMKVNPVRHLAGGSISKV